MTISDPKEAFVWTWLPGETEPVVVGRLMAEGSRFDFAYGRSFLERENAIPLYVPELPLKRGNQSPLGALDMASCLRDGLPDHWGRRVIINRLTGKSGEDASKVEFGDLIYMLESGSDRIGALDFQASATEFEYRGGGEASLDDLAEFADKIEEGVPVPQALEQAILHGSSIGGARPKALLEDGGRKLIAKFSASNDVIRMVKAEFVAMRLAAHVGINVAPAELKHALGKDVLIVERFDRVRTRNGGWAKRSMVSALTIFGLNEISAHHASYTELADHIRARFVRPRETLRELFLRMVFNILVGNTDDHARNHAAFWDGAMLELTPAYDIAPQVRASREANQAIMITENDRRSRLATCLLAADSFLLKPSEAREIVDRAVEDIRSNWLQVCEEAELTEVERKSFEGRQFLNPYAFESY